MAGSSCGVCVIGGPVPSERLDWICICLQVPSVWEPPVESDRSRLHCVDIEIAGSTDPSQPAQWKWNAERSGSRDAGNGIGDGESGKEVDGVTPNSVSPRPRPRFLCSPFSRLRFSVSVLRSLH
jgi:hypothetical protein